MFQNLKQIKSQVLYKAYNMYKQNSNRSNGNILSTIVNKTPKTAYYNIYSFNIYSLQVHNNRLIF